MCNEMSVTGLFVCLLSFLFCLRTNEAESPHSSSISSSSGSGTYYLPFIYPQFSLVSSQEFATGHCAVPVESSRHFQILFNTIFHLL